MLKAYSFFQNGELVLSKNFKVKEFKCRDGSDPVLVDTELVGLLQNIRDHFGKPLHITSGWRTASHNAKTKNASKYSQHLYGKAADFWVEGVTPQEVYAYAEKLLREQRNGLGGLGVYPPELGRECGWVHLDVRDAKSRWKG